MIKKLIKLTVFLLIVYALYHVTPVWLRYYQFKDAVQEMALFTKEKSDPALIDHVMKIAQEQSVPLAREYVQVRRSGDRILIDASYVDTLKLLPGYEYPWQFDIGVAAWQVQTPR